MPAGCLSLVALGFALIFLIVAVVFGAMKSSDVYKDALRRAQNDPNVIAALGTPVKDGMYLTGSTKTEGATGEANLSVPIHGPKGKGTLYVVAVKSQGKWVYQTLAVELADGGRRIALPGDAQPGKAPKDDDEEDAADSDDGDDSA